MNFRDSAARPGPRKEVVEVLGGFFRALGLLASGSPDWTMRAALVVELVGAPLLYLWQRRIAQLQPMDAAVLER